MRKSGVVALGAGLLAVAGLAGYFAVDRYAGARAQEEVDAAFAALRASGAEARHGAVSADAARRAVNLSDVVIASPDGSASVKIARLDITGLGQPKDGRIAADALALDGIEVSLRGRSPAAGTVAVTVPKLQVAGFAGPLGAAAPGTGPAGVAIAALQKVSALTAGKLTAPEATVRLAFDADAPVTELRYAGIAAEDLKAGTIRSLLLDSVAFTVTSPAPPDGGGPVSGEVRGTAVSELNLLPLVATLAPAGPPAPDASYEKLYDRLVTGPYVVRTPDGVSSASSTLVEQAGIRPSGLSLEDLVRLKILAVTGVEDEEAVTPEVLGLAAKAVESVAFRTLAVSGMEMQDKAGKGRLASTRLDGFAAGKLDVFTVEGFDGTDADGHAAKLGRLAIHQLDLGRILAFAAEDGVPSPREVFQVLRAVEISDAQVPYDTDGPARGTPVTVGSFTLSWSDMLGELPTRLVMKLDNASGPIEADDGEPFTYLVNAGITRATLSFSLEAAYDASTAVLSVKPVGIVMDKAFAVAFEGGLGNVPAVAFENDEAAAAAFGEVTGRPMRVTLPDLGLGQLMLTQLADAAGATPADLKAEVIAHVDELAQLFSMLSPDIPAVAAAVKQFIETPGTLTLTATPKGEAPLLPLISGDGPIALLQAFSISAEAKP